jgi:RNA polymerase sigma factor (sigma-70 family)
VNERTDSDLLRDYTENGSEAAFAELVRRHVDAVYSSALRLVVDSHLAEDVTQSTFAILAREARHLAGRTILSGWLHRTAINIAAKLVRTEMRRRAREQEAYAMEILRSPSDSAWKQLAPRLDDALNRLGDADRAVIFLRYFEKKTVAEISAVLKLSEEAAQKRVTRALERLRGILASGGATLSVAAFAELVSSQGVMAAPAGLSTSVTTTALGAGAASAGITLTTLKLIVMSKLKVSTAAVLIAAGVSTPLVLQHQHLSRLRQENESLRKAGLRAEKEKVAAQTSDSSRQQELSKAQLAELLRLRGEVGPLRRDSQELARLRLAQQAKQAAPAEPRPADFIPAAAWANVGIDRPEAAMQTFFWAGKHGETNLVGNLLRWQRDADIPQSDELDQTFAKSLIVGTTRYFGSLQGFRVTTQQQHTEDEIRMGIELTNKDGKAESHTLRLVREDDQWFPVMHVRLHDQGTIRAAMDVPPEFAQAQ